MEDRKQKVLLVEDDGTLRTLYTDLLVGEGVDVESAVEGNEGLEKAKYGGYALILLDILLPGLQGPQILEKLREHQPPQPNGPIVMLTNQDQPEILKKCTDLGAAGYVIKSKTTPEQFVKEMRSYLKSTDIVNQENP